MAEDLDTNWWDNDPNKNFSEDENEKSTKDSKKKNKRKRKRITEVDTNLMSTEEEVIAALSELVGNVAKEELADWLSNARIRMVLKNTKTNFS